MFGTRPRTQPCQHCGREISQDAKFCPFCGEPTAANLGPCPHCGKPVAADAKYCPHCSRPLTARREPDVRDSVWRASPDDYAVRIERGDLEGVVYKEIEVQPGQQVLLLADGRALEERKGPGRYTVKSVFDWLIAPAHGRHVTALLVQGGPVNVDFELARLFTADNFEIKGRCAVVVEVTNPPVFFANVMRGRQTFTRSDLRAFLFDQVRDGVQDVVRRQKLADLPTGLTVKSQLVTAILAHLERTLADSGLGVVEVRTTEFIHPRFDALRKQWEDILIFRDEAEAERTKEVDLRQAGLQKRRSLWDVDLAAEDQETVERRDRVRLFEDRAAVAERLRQAMFSDRANEIRSEEDLADFIAGIDEHKVLRQEQIDVFKEGYASRQEDRHAARAQVAYLAELERDYERKRADLARRTDLTLAGMAANLQVEQQKLVDAGALDEKRWDVEMAEMVRGADRAEWDRAEKIKVDLFDRSREKDGALHRRELERAETVHEIEMRAIRTDADLTDAEKRANSDVELANYTQERAAIERSIRQADFDENLRQQAAEDKLDMDTARMATDLLAKMKQDKLAAEETARRIAREDELERAATAHKQELERRTQDMLAEAQRQGHELAMLQARADMSAEALITLSSPDQARIIADLKQTEALKGMSDEAIYAMMAKDSAPLAAALTERFKAMQADPAAQQAEVKALYERMLADIQKDKEKQAELQRRTDEQYLAMYNKALDSQRDGMVEIAKATSHPPAASTPPIVITGGAGAPPVVYPAAGAAGGYVSGEVQICPNCRSKSPVGVKFCTTCGHKFYE